MGLEVWIGERGMWLRYSPSNEHRVSKWVTPFGVDASISPWAPPEARHGRFVAWGDIQHVEACDPWPGLRIVTAPRDVVYHLRRLRAFEPEEDDLVTFEKTVVDVLEMVGRSEHAATRRGWIDALHVPWEPVKELPKNDPSRARSGAYRTASVPILVERGRPGPLSALLQWLASRPERPWRRTAREAVLTPEHLYAEHWDGTRARIPVEALRARLTNEYDDQVWVFGRRSFLVLPHQRGCELTAQLERRLAAGDASRA